MLRKYAQLLAPAAVVDEGGASAAATLAERPMSKWMGAIGEIGEPAAAPNKEEPNASPNDTSGRPAAGEPANKQPVGDAADAKAKEAAEAKRLEAEKIKTAAEKATDKPGDKPADDADEKWPRNSQDWDKFKAKRKERETALREENTAVANKLKAAEAKVVEFETKLKAVPTVDPAMQSENERLKAANQALSERITVLDVTQHPQFISYFDNKTRIAHEDAGTILGKEKGEEFVKLLKLPDSEWKKGELESFYAGLTDVEKSEIGTVTRELRAIERERQDEIKKAGEHKDKLTTDGAARAKVMGEQRQKAIEGMFSESVKAVQDPENGVPVFQLREGDEAWNGEVAKRIESVKSLLLAKDLKPESVVRGAFNAVALPAFLQSYAADKKAWGDEKAKLEAQVKALSAAQPSGDDNGGGHETETKLPADTNPHERSKAWAASMVKGLNSIGQ